MSRHHGLRPRPRQLPSRSRPRPRQLVGSLGLMSGQHNFLFFRDDPEPWTDQQYANKTHWSSNATTYDRLFIPTESAELTRLCKRVFSTVQVKHQLQPATVLPRRDHSRNLHRPKPWMTSTLPLIISQERCRSTSTYQLHLIRSTGHYCSG